MSTKVDLPAAISTERAAGHASKKQKTTDFSDAPPTLSMYPVEIQRYMQAEGFSEPTEIQERYAAMLLYEIMLPSGMLGHALDVFFEDIQRFDGFCGTVATLFCRCWPECLKGRDVRAVAEPGSGKTLGYLLPSLPWLVKRLNASNQSASGPGVLILVPTRCSTDVRVLNNSRFYQHYCEEVSVAGVYKKAAMISLQGTGTTGSSFVPQLEGVV